MIVEVGHVQNPGTNVPVGVQRLEAAIKPGKADVPVWRPSIRKNQHFSTKAIRQENSLLLGEESVFVLFMHSPDWVQSILIMEVNVLYSSTDLSSSNTPSQKHQHKIWPNIWARYGAVKLTHKINHHCHALWSPLVPSRVVKRWNEKVGETLAAAQEMLAIIVINRSIQRSKSLI